MATLPGPVLAFCNSGNRARALYSRDVGTTTTPAETISAACDWEHEAAAVTEAESEAAGAAAVSAASSRDEAAGKSIPVTPACNWDNAFDIVVVGGGSAGLGSLPACCAGVHPCVSPSSNRMTNITINLPGHWSVAVLMRWIKPFAIRPMSFRTALSGSRRKYPDFPRMTIWFIWPMAAPSAISS